MKIWDSELKEIEAFQKTLQNSKRIIKLNKEDLNRDWTKCPQCLRSVPSKNKAFIDLS